MTAAARIAAQIAVLTALFAAAVAFADWPRYQQIPSESAVIKLSFTHGSNRKADCRVRTAEELAKLPPNMRKPLDCPRTRGAVYVELDLDGQTIYRASLPPSGLSGDGPPLAFVVRQRTPSGRLRTQNWDSLQDWVWAPRNKLRHRLSPIEGLIS
jgi:hypothetical protein